MARFRRQRNVEGKYIALPEQLGQVVDILDTVRPSLWSDHRISASIISAPQCTWPWDGIWVDIAASRTRYAPPFEPIDDRIEQISEGEGRDEWRQSALQRPQHGDGYGDDGGARDRPADGTLNERAVRIGRRRARRQGSG